MTWKGRLRKVKEKLKQLDFEALRIRTVVEEFVKILKKRVDNRVGMSDSLESKYATMVKDVGDTIPEVERIQKWLPLLLARVLMRDPAVPELN